MQKTAFKLALQASLKEIETIYIAQAYERDQLVAFVKLLLAFVVYKEGNSVNANFFSKINSWFQESLPLQAEIKVIKPVAAIMKQLNSNKLTIPDNKYAAYVLLLKNLREAIYAPANKANRAALFETNKTTKQLNNLMTVTFTLINKAGTPKDNDNAYNTITRNVSLLGDAQLSGYFLPLASNKEGKKAVQVYLKMVQNFMGDKNAQYVSKEFLNDKLPKLPKNIQANFKIARAAETKAYNTARLNIIRGSGEPLMDADKLKAELIKAGMTTFRIPEGFTGKYDDKGAMYLPDGRKLNANQLGGTFKLLKERDGVAKVATGQGIYDQGPKDFQTLENTQKSSKDKFALVQSMLPRLREFAQKWRSDFAFEDSPTKLYGAMAETIYLTAGRMGGVDKSGKVVGGISTLVAKNILKSGNGIKINYIGKKQIEQTHIIKPDSEIKQLLVNFLWKLKEDKSPNAYLWEYDGYKISGDGFSKYLKNEVQFGASPHKFRHLKGTRLFMDMIKKYPIAKNASSADIDKHVKEILGVIGGELGHMKTNKEGKQETTWSTAAKNYVDPTPIKEIYKEHDKPYPSWLPLQSDD